MHNIIKQKHMAKRVRNDGQTFYEQAPKTRKGKETLKYSATSRNSLKDTEVREDE
ncbi:MAG: hypothetical protein CM15mP113_1110 [Pseudomonadota bacterium]|nr:MAG: hypothetical protein CM15mP113_1110 [Pseudomonadota bacterium]